MSKPFRLQSLLDHKRQQEERQTLALAALDAQCRRARAALDGLHGQEQEQLRRIGALARGGLIDAVEYRDALSYLVHLEGAIAQQAVVVVDAEERVLESRDVLVATLKEKRSLEHLRERHSAEVATEENRREAGIVDELTSARHARLDREGI